MSIETDKKIEKNFNDICKYIMESTGINLLDEYDDIPKKYYRISYDGIGIYEALKQNMTFGEWKEFLNSENVKWLPKPPSYSDSAMSYFTQNGYEMFIKTLMPIILTKLDKNKVVINTFTDLENIVYEDEYQVITDDISLADKYNESLDTLDDLLSAQLEYDPPLPYDQLPEHLKKDPVHVWRAKTGIELIHKEPTLAELKRIWKNWLLMDDDMKKTSDEKSMEFFGMDNRSHYYYLLRAEYKDDDNDGNDYIEEKSHSKLKYCYRIGFDMNNGEQVAIQFDLDPDSITFVGDMDLTKKAFNIQTNDNVEISDEMLYHVHNDALNRVKNEIAKYGHIDFVTNELPVSAIFYKGGKSLQVVELIPMFSKPVIDFINKAAIRFTDFNKSKDSLNDLFNMPLFKNGLVESLKNDKIIGEEYKVGTESGKGKYKTTKLLWDFELFKSYAFTPMIRGYNIKGDGWNKEAMMKYNINTKFKSLKEEVDFITDMENSVYPSYTPFNKKPSFDKDELQKYIESNNISGINKILNPDIEKIFINSFIYDNKSFNEAKILKSDLDDNYKKKEYKDLSSFTRQYLTKEHIKKFKDKGKLIKYMRDQDSFDDTCYIWTDNDDDYVGAITYNSKADENGYIFLSAIDVSYKYLGCGIGKQLLEEAIKGGVNALNVQIDNKIAIKMYTDRGFKISKESENAVKSGKSKRYDMYLDKKEYKDLDWIDRFVHDDIFRNSVDVNPYTIKTPEELLKWMDCIRYGWIDNNYNVNGTGDDDDEMDFYKYYRLQSPSELIKSHVGVCWDQVELEREWFKKHNIDHCIIYIEINNGEACPTHTFLLYNTENKVCWFEHSWGTFKGIHEYTSISNSIKDIISKHQRFNNDFNSPIICTQLKDIPKYNCTCEEFMNFAHSQSSIDLNNISNELFDESGQDIVSEITSLNEELKNINPLDIKYDHSKYYGLSEDEFYRTVIPNSDKLNLEVKTESKHLALPDYTCKKCKTVFKDVEILYVPKNDYNTAIKEFPSWDGKYGNLGMLLCPNCGERNYVISEGENLDLDILSENVDTNSLPDKLYFSSPNELTGKTISAKLPRGLFLSPFIGISSMFIIDRHEEMHNYMNDILRKNNRELTYTNYNIEYGEWNIDSKLLQKPLNRVHLFHNIPEFKEIRTGSSTGYIYAINVSSVKNELQSYVTNDINKEVIYRGSSKLPIIGKMEHTIDWEISYKKQDTIGKFGTKPISESYDILSEKINCDILFTEDENKISEESEETEDADVEVTNEEPPSLDDEEPPNIMDDTDETQNDTEENKTDENSSVEETQDEPEKKESMPKQTDRAESDKNGVRRKKLYVAFIEWCKSYNSKNTFGSVFDKDAFHVSYPFVPEEMRYFYRLANPMLCVLAGDLTFFALTELRKINSKNSNLQEIMIFAATPDTFRVFNKKDKKIYLATEENGTIKLGQSIGDTFDTYLQTMINQGDILNSEL